MDDRPINLSYKIKKNWREINDFLKKKNSIIYVIVLIYWVNDWDN
jgi:hypothetical protein